MDHTRPNAPPAPLLASVSEAAHLLAVSQKYVRSLMAAGKLPLIRLGRRTMVRRADVEALAATGCGATKPAGVGGGS